MKRFVVGFLAVFIIGVSAQVARAQTEVDVWFWPDNYQTRGQWYLKIEPAGFDPAVPRDMLVVLHGAGSNRTQPVRSTRDEFRALRDLAAERQMLYVAPDYRQTTSWTNAAAESDIVQIVTTLMGEAAIDRVFIAGASMGGHGALVMLSRHSYLFDGAISLNGTANMLEFAGFASDVVTAYGDTKQNNPLEYKARSPEYWPETFTSSVAFAVGGADAVVPPHSVLRLHSILQILQKPSFLIHRPTGGHSTNYEDTRNAALFVLGD